MKCLFCNKLGPYSTIEHIVPESLGNTTLLLSGQVCDACQSYFGKEVEKYVLERSPIGAWRVFAGIKTKHGASPKFSFKQPKHDKGHLPDRHPVNDDGVTFYSSLDGKQEYGIDDEKLLKEIEEGEKTNFKLVLTPKMLYMMARFLGKIGLEILARDYPNLVRTLHFDQIRQFTRYGQPVRFLWPIFYGTTGGAPTATPCEVCVLDSNPDRKTTYTLSILTLGSECWIICLNDPYPTPEIKKSFPNIKIQALTY